MLLLTFVLISALVIIVMFTLTVSFYTFMKSVEPSKIPNKELPFVSVVIPARNEETKIGRCLQSLLDQDYPNMEIIVIDDRSTDRTGEIIDEFAAKDSRIKSVKGKDAPEGWIGKCNALAYAVGHASGDFYIFTDADTCHEKNSIRDSVSYAISNKADLISFIPLQELGSFWEKVVMPTLLGSFLLGDPFHSVNDPKASRAYAYGQYIICRRSSYLALGGHQAVRDEIVEDHALGRVFKEKGYKILCADGKTLYKVRMYTDLESMWQGWTKNLYSLIDSKIFNLVVILWILNSVCLAPVIAAAIVAYMWATGDTYEYLGRVTTIVVAQFAIMVLYWRLTDEHRLGVNWGHFFLLPLGAISVTVLNLHAAYLVLSGSKVKWKGRQYTVNTSKTIQSGVGSSIDTKLDAAALTDGRD